MQAKPTRQKIVLESPVLKPDQPVPRKYTTQGEDVSPPLTWSNLPPGTREIVVALEDHDTTITGDHPFFQWMVYGIPATATGLPEHVSEFSRIMKPASIEGACQAHTRFDINAYRGPQPPPGEIHHYRFVVYALDAKLDLPPDKFPNTVLADIEKHIIGEGEINATYKRTP